MRKRIQNIPDSIVNALVRAYFTKTNLIIHAIVYPLLMIAEGGDFHLFLDGISIEAVFVGLLVGISTKQVIEHHHGLSRTLADLAHHIAHRNHDHHA